jgi:hypothetical protein
LSGHFKRDQATPHRSEGGDCERWHIVITGFEKIVEERIKKAQKEGMFDNLPGKGAPLTLDQEPLMASELKLAYKILKNADCLPPELELKKEIERTEELLAGMPDAAQRHRLLKKLNYMIMKVNAARGGNYCFDIPQHYEHYVEAMTDQINPAENKNSGT